MHNNTRAGCTVERRREINTPKTTSELKNGQRPYVELSKCRLDCREVPRFDLLVQCNHVMERDYLGRDPWMDGTEQFMKGRKGGFVKGIVYM